MLRSLYDKILRLANSPRASWWLAAISFIESSVFPIPPDVMLVPMAVANRTRAFHFALICSVASVIGAVLGYIIGFFLWDSVGQPIFEMYGYMDEFALFQDGFKEWGAWLVFVFGLTFFPYKVITIASGVVALDPVVFILASIGARFPRFFIEAALLWKFGDPIRDFIERRLVLITSAVVLLIVGGFAAIKLLGS